MSDLPKEFKDKNGKVIKAGDLLIRHFYVRRREHPGRRRVAIQGMSGNEVIVSDEGGLLDAERHWITYRAEWDGACLIADRDDCSDLNIVLQSSKFDENGNPINEGDGFHYFNSVFDSTVYEIINEIAALG